MGPRPLASDTPLEIERQQIEQWRRMSPEEKAAIVAGLTNAVFELALEGLRARYPGASPRELLLRRLVLLHGRELAARACPDVLALQPE